MDSARANLTVFRKYSETQSCSLASYGKPRNRIWHNIVESSVVIVSRNVQTKTDQCPKSHKVHQCLLRDEALHSLAIKRQPCCLSFLKIASVSFGYNWVSDRCRRFRDLHSLWFVLRCIWQEAAVKPVYKSFLNSVRLYSSLFNCSIFGLFWAHASRVVNFKLARVS